MADGEFMITDFDQVKGFFREQCVIAEGEQHHGMSEDIWDHIREFEEERMKPLDEMELDDILHCLLEWCANMERQNRFLPADGA